MLVCQESPPGSAAQPPSPQCQFFVVRKKRLCRMTVRPGRNYCGEHEPEPRVEQGQNDTRIPCPNDPKHTCYASKLQKHLSICNARAGPRPPYEQPGVNAPPPPAGAAPRRALQRVPRDEILRLIEKVDRLYDEHIKDHIVSAEEQPVHAAVAADLAAADRAEGSRRHLRQASALLRLAEAAGLVRDGTCYVELGAGKGHLSYYAWRAWCGGARGRVLLVDRASLRHKRDNKLRDLAAGATQHSQTEGVGPESESAEPADPADPSDPTAVSSRLRADLADLSLAHAPAVAAAAHVVGLAKHLCGAATDFALRCVTAAEVVGKTRGLVLATCCHHRCEPHSMLGKEYIKELGITEQEMDVLLGVVSWGTCGDGRSRTAPAARPGDTAGDASGDATGDTVGDATGDTTTEGAEAFGLRLPRAAREGVGLRAKALVDWGRARALGARGLRARLVRFVPAHVSPENLAIVATRD